MQRNIPFLRRRHFWDAACTTSLHVKIISFKTNSSSLFATNLKITEPIETLFASVAQDQHLHNHFEFIEAKGIDDAPLMFINGITCDVSEVYFKTFSLP